MFTAIARYHFKPKCLEAGLKVWEEAVLNRIEEQPGFMGVQVYTQEEGYVMVIGTWEAPEHAQQFMRTGIFKDIVEQLSPYLAETPEQGAWKMRHYIGR